MKPIDKFSSGGINPRFTWVYEQHGIVAGVVRNNSIAENRYYCFENVDKGENCETIWYPDLKSAKKVVIEYLNGHRAYIPMNKC